MGCHGTIKIFHTKKENNKMTTKGKQIGTIDLEPTWENLCNMAQSGHLQPKELMQACKLADIVRQAQKQGKKSVTFTFPNNKEAEVEILP